MKNFKSIKTKIPSRRRLARDLEKLKSAIDFDLKSQTLTRQQRDTRDIIQCTNYYVKGIIHEREYLNALEFYIK